MDQFRKINSIIITGQVVKGHGVASGPSREYPYGSLERQLPLFKAAGLDLSRFFLGTLNISIAPATFRLVNPAYTFQRVAWTDLHPAEDFSFSPCRVSLSAEDKWYDGYIYYPHPETKIRHYQNPSLIEVITEKIPGVQYGTKIHLEIDPDQVEISAL